MAKLLKYSIGKAIKEGKNKSWNYRVLRKIEPPVDINDHIQWPSEEIFGIIEVYYTDGKITSFATYKDGEELSRDMYGEAKHMSPFGNSLDSLRADIELMAEAFKLPVLEYDQLMAEVEKKD